MTETDSLLLNWPAALDTSRRAAVRSLRAIAALDAECERTMAEARALRETFRSPKKAQRPAKRARDAGKGSNRGVATLEASPKSAADAAADEEQQLASWARLIDRSRSLAADRVQHAEAVQAVMRAVYRRLSKHRAT